MLNHVYGSEDIYEIHVISGLAYGPHTLLKVFLKLGVSVTDFLIHLKHSIVQDQLAQIATDKSKEKVQIIDIDDSENEK